MPTDHRDNQADGHKSDAPEPCPQCGGTGKRWQMLSGQWVCDECWLETAQDMLTTGGWRLASAALRREPFTPTASNPRRLVNPSPGNGLTRRPGAILHSTSRGGRDAVGITGCRIQAQPKEHPYARPPVPDRWKKALDSLLTPAYNSCCLLCGHIFYGAALSSCSRCGGRTVQRSDKDLGLMGRRGTQLAEAGE